MYKRLLLCVLTISLIICFEACGKDVSTDQSTDFTDGEIDEDSFWNDIEKSTGEETSITTVATTTTTQETTLTTTKDSTTLSREFTLIEVFDLYLSSGSNFSYAEAQNNYEALKQELVNEFNLTSMDFEVSDKDANFHFVGPYDPNNPRDGWIKDISAWYSWNIPNTLTAGSIVELNASGGYQLISTGEGITSTSVFNGELNYYIFMGPEQTLDVDYRGDGAGIKCVEGAVNNVLPELGENETSSSGSYSLEVPGDDYYRTIAIVVVFEPIHGGYSIVKTYIFQR